MKTNWYSNLIVHKNAKCDPVEQFKSALQGPSIDILTFQYLSKRTRSSSTLRFVRNTIRGTTRIESNDHVRFVYRTSATCLFSTIFEKQCLYFGYFHISKVSYILKHFLLKRQTVALSDLLLLFFRTFLLNNCQRQYWHCCQ